jgi:hypothetical protein
MSEVSKDVPSSTVETPVSIPAQAVSAPVGIVPVRAEVLILKMNRRAARILETWTAAVTAFFILLAGIVDLFTLHNPSLNGIPPVLSDLGLFTFGIFFGVAVMDKLDRLSAALGLGIRKTPVVKPASTVQAKPTPPVAS